MHGDEWWAYYAFAQIYIGEPLGGIAAAWSLCIEVAFYAAIPFFALAMARVPGRTPRGRLRGELAGLAVLFVMAYVFRVIVGVDGLSLESSVDVAPVTFLDWFALGMLMAVFSAWLDGREGASPGWLRPFERYPGILWAAAAAVFVGDSLYFDGKILNYTLLDNLIEHAAFGFIAFALIAPLTFGDRRQGLLRRVLDNRVLLYLGLVSYGIFLWHEAVIQQLVRWDLGQVGFIHPYLLWYLPTLAITVAIASVSYYALERPDHEAAREAGPARCRGAARRGDRRAHSGRPDDGEGARLGRTHTAASGSPSRPASRSSGRSSHQVTAAVTAANTATSASACQAAAPRPHSASRSPNAASAPAATGATPRSPSVSSSTPGSSLRTYTRRTTSVTSAPAIRPHTNPAAPQTREPRQRKRGERRAPSRATPPPAAASRRARGRTRTSSSRSAGSRRRPRAPGAASTAGSHSSPSTKPTRSGANRIEPGAERQRPHHREPVRLDEQLLERLDPVAHRADRRVDRVRDDDVRAVRVAGERVRERDVAGRRQPAVEGEREQLPLLHHEQRQRVHEDRPREAQVAPPSVGVEAQPKAVWRRQVRRHDPRGVARRAAR